MATRKRVILTLDCKVKVIRQHEKGICSRQLAAEFGVGKTQINNIVTAKADILKLWDDGVNGRRKLVAARRCPYVELNAKVFDWFCSARSRNIPLTGRLLQAKASELSREMGHDGFTASNGWLHRFQKRHNIKCSVLSGESADVKEEVVAEWSERLASKCEEFELKDIFNADETGLFFRSLPCRSLVAKGDDCKGGKLSKDRVTVLLCASATGEKLMPLVIGRSANPRCFKSCHRTSLRVTYESNKKAWMTGEMFAGWMRRIDNQMRLQNRHILMFLDNCGAHPALQFDNLKVVFLPPNTTSRLQPMDAGIIQNMKVVYRKKLLRHILFLMNEARTASDIIKKVTVLDAILWLTTAWDSVSPETIQKCFRKCGFSDAIVDASSDDEWDEEDLRPLLPPGTSLRDYVDSDDHVAMQRTIDDNWKKVCFYFLLIQSSIIILYMPSVYFMTITSYSTTMHSNRVGLQCGA